MIPLLKPAPPRLSEAGPALRQIEDSGIFSNFGPVNKRFEQDLLDHMFAGEGACLTVCNATLGLMVAMRQAISVHSRPRRYALMPSFTFAAAAQAALWCGLTPLLCDIDPHNWAADHAAEDALIRRYRDEIAVVVPYATFGYDIDLAWYESLRRERGIPVVVDAAASLGTLNAQGAGFGTGFGGAVVFSMHATKSFATGEGGIVYSGDAALIRELRTMCNFGFGQPRTATMPGLNAKLSEIGALQALLQLGRHEAAVQARAELMAQYRAMLPDMSFQAHSARIQAHQFAPILLPAWAAPFRNRLQASMAEAGIGTAAYFSPHLAEQDYFTRTAIAGPLDVTNAVAARIMSLPIYDSMRPVDVESVAATLEAALSALHEEAEAHPTAWMPALAASGRPARGAAGWRSAPPAAHLPPPVPGRSHTNRRE